MYKLFGLIIEKFCPIIFSSICFLCLIYWNKYFSNHFSSTGGWKVDALYNSIFGWSSVQVGFVFGVYGFVVGKKDGFIEAIKNTKAMNRFSSYLRSANILGFILAISSLPLMVINPDISNGYSIEYRLVSLWFCLFLWSFLTFLRISVTFGVLVSTKDHDEFYGA